MSADNKTKLEDRRKGDRRVFQKGSLSAFVSPLFLESSPVQVCEVTGIAFSISSVGFSYLSSFSYRCPIADIKNARQTIKENHLKSLPKEILAGLILSIYKHHSLLYSGGQNAGACNALLQSATTESLVSLINHSKALSKELYSLPCLSLDPSSFLHSGIDGALQNYCSIIGDNLTESQRNRFGLTSSEAKISIRRTSLALSPTISKAKFEVVQTKAEREEIFQDRKKQAKALFSSISCILQPSLSSILSDSLKGRTLATLNKVVRGKIVAALQAYENKDCQALASLIAVAEDPRDPLSMDDIFSTVFDDVEDLAINNKPKRTLAEIIAAKKAAKGE